MPHWDAYGNEEWVCQLGAHICTGRSTWVEKIGNVCPKHMKPGFYVVLLKDKTHIGPHPTREAANATRDTRPSTIVEVP